MFAELSKPYIVSESITRNELLFHF